MEYLGIFLLNHLPLCSVELPLIPIRFPFTFQLSLAVSSCLSERDEDLPLDVESDKYSTLPYTSSAIIETMI